MQGRVKALTAQLKTEQLARKDLDAQLFTLQAQRASALAQQLP